MSTRPMLQRLDSDKDSGIGDPLTLSGFRSLCGQYSLTEVSSTDFTDSDQFLMMSNGGKDSPSDSTDEKNKDSAVACSLADDDAISVLSEENQPEYEVAHPWKKVRINVCGVKTETYYQVIDRFPQTLLGDPEKRKRFWDKERKEFYFDTHSASFEAIFQWYQTGILQKPEFVPLQTFLEQLDYFGIEGKTLEDFQRSVGLSPPKVHLQPEAKWARYLWDAFEHPNSSIIARIIGIISVLFILLSLAVFCVETLPEHQGNDCLNVTVKNKDGVHFRDVPNFRNVFFLLETLCIAWFTVEFFVRIISCPNKLLFLKNPLNIIDILSILPYYIIVTIMVITQSCKLGKLQSVLPILRILRVFRVFKLTRHSRDLRVLMLTLRSSLKELGVSLLFLIFGTTLSAVMIYVAEEKEPDSQINSVAEGVWWAVATMTTVGYGDIVPVGLYGKMVGGVCVILGTLVLALPAPIIVTNFNRFYESRKIQN